MLGAAGSLLTEVAKSGKVARGCHRASGAARHAVQVRPAMPGGVRPVCALRQWGFSEHVRARVKRAAAACDEQHRGADSHAAILQKRACRVTAKDESASSSASFRRGHDRSVRESERAWRRARSPVAPTRHPYHFLATSVSTDPHHRTLLSFLHALQPCNAPHMPVLPAPASAGGVNIWPPRG